MASYLISIPGNYASIRQAKVGSHPRNVQTNKDSFLADLGRNQVYSACMLAKQALKAYSSNINTVPQHHASYLKICDDLSNRILVSREE